MKDMNKIFNQSVLMHYAIASLLCKTIMLLGFGWWMGFTVTMLVQTIWELKSRRIWINERFKKGEIGFPLFYIKHSWKKEKLYDVIYNTAATIISCLLFAI